jgi:transitional endoplasmic reticulum ATPase
VDANIDAAVLDSMTITNAHFATALTTVKASALRETVVEVATGENPLQGE